MSVILQGNGASTSTWHHKSRNHLHNLLIIYGKWSSQKTSDLEAPATRLKTSHHRNRPPATANLWCCYHCCLPNYNPKWCSFYLEYRYYQLHLRCFLCFNSSFKANFQKCFGGDHHILDGNTSYTGTYMCNINDLCKSNNIILLQPSKIHPASSLMASSIISHQAMDNLPFHPVRLAICLP